ncbi:M56 family metallopeptidase, partial [Streptomyces beijiangensis]
RTAAWSLTCAAVVAAGAWVTVLTMLALTLIGQIPLIAAEAEWSPSALARATPVDRPVAAACAGAVLACAITLTAVSWRNIRVLLDAWRECRSLPAAGDLAVVDDPVPTAFALPGAPGRVVVSSGMLQALDADERRALLAHERAHLRHRHHLFLLTLQLAAAVNPLLRPLTRTGTFVMERWADESAATAVGSRKLVAQAVARAALAAKRAPRTTALAAVGGPVPQRVQALLTPPAPLRRGVVTALAALMAVCCIALAHAGRDIDHIFDTASPEHGCRVTAPQQEHRSHSPHPCHRESAQRLS